MLRECEHRRLAFIEPFGSNIDVRGFAAALERVTQAFGDDVNRDVKRAQAGSERAPQIVRSPSGFDAMANEPRFGGVFLL